MTFMTRDQALASAQAITFPSQPFINGTFRPTSTGERFTSINPATGEALTEIEACGVDDLNLAVEAAKASFEAGVWSDLHPSERKSIFCVLQR